MEKCARLAKNIYEQANNQKLMLVWRSRYICNIGPRSVWEHTLIYDLHPGLIYGFSLPTPHHHTGSVPYTRSSFLISFRHWASYLLFLRKEGMWVCEAPKRLSHTYTLDYICTSISILMGAKFNVWTYFWVFPKSGEGKLSIPCGPSFLPGSRNERKWSSAPRGIAPETLLVGWIRTTFWKCGGAQISFKFGACLRMGHIPISHFMSM